MLKDTTCPVIFILFAVLNFNNASDDGESAAGNTSTSTNAPLKSNSIGNVA